MIQPVILPRGSVCVFRSVNGRTVVLRIDPQSNWREWSGAFSLLADTSV